jgi:hypothetical protein
MSARRTVRTCVVLAAALLAAAGAGRALDRIERAALPKGIAQAPAGMGFLTVALGGFRGIAADLLWLRATRLQDDGRYVELSQLAEWIAALEPQCTQVWAFHAWNMAYNISAMMADAEDRWRWVRSGLRLLQERGLAANGDDPAMYAEIAWMQLQKIGGFMEGDDPEYPRRWTAEMDRVLPQGRLPEQGAEEAAVAEGRLREAYRMDMDRMRRMEALYGDLDWGSPYAHAGYWALTGRDLHPGERDLACERLLYQSLAQAFFAGTPARSEDGSDGLRPPAPRLDLLEGVFKSLDEAAGAHPDDTGIREAVRGFAESAMVLLHAAGREPDARRVFDRRLAQAGPGGAAAPDYTTFVTDPSAVERLPPAARRAVQQMQQKETPR